MEKENIASKSDFEEFHDCEAMELKDPNGSDSDAADWGEEEPV